MKIKTLQAWVREALKSKDREYQLVEVCRTIAELERERCAKMALNRMKVTAGTERESCRLIAQWIRDLT